MVLARLLFFVFGVDSTRSGLRVLAVFAVVAAMIAACLKVQGTW